VSNPPVLEARHLSRRFFGISVVHDVSLLVRPGDVVGYLGPNGSGKTTTLRMLTGQLAPSEGQVLFCDRDIDTHPLELRRRLGYVPEEPQLYPFLSGVEFLRLVGQLRQIPHSLLERKIAGLMELFGLADASDQDVGSYSKGMKQKLLISGALLHDPDLLIFDEPESGLDVTTALVLRHLVRALAARGKAVLYSSHILEVVEKVCTKVIVLHRGRIVADDSVAHLRELLSRDSLEGVFKELVLKIDPETTANDIADVAALRG